MQEMWVQSLGQEDPLEKEMQPIPVFSPGKSHGQRSLVGYSSQCYKRVGHDLAAKTMPPPLLFTILLHQQDLLSLLFCFHFIFLPCLSWSLSPSSHHGNHNLIIAPSRCVHLQLHFYGSLSLRPCHLIPCNRTHQMVVIYLTGLNYYT